MNANDLVKLVVGVVVGALMLSAILVPMINDATTTNRTFENNEYFITMDKIGPEDGPHTITWEKVNPNVIVVDDVEITPTWESITIFAEEDNLLRCSKASTGYYLNFVGATQPVGYGSINDKSVSVTIDDGTVTFSGVSSSDNTYSTNSTFNVGYIINPDNEGQYSFVLKTPNAKAYVLGDSEIYGIGFSNVGGAWQNIFSISGTINDGIDVTLVSTTLSDNPTISNEATVYTTVSGYEDLYQFEKETFTATYDGTATNLTYSYVIVPASVTAELSDHADQNTIQMLEVIPILVTVGLILGVVGVAFSRRD